MNHAETRTMFPTLEAFVNDVERLRGLDSKALMTRARKLEARSLNDANAVGMGSIFYSERHGLLRLRPQFGERILSALYL